MVGTDVPVEPGSSLGCRVSLAVLGVFVALVVGRIHGYSLPWFHRLVDGSPTPEVIVGAARGIRSDDWAVELPMMLAQAAHRPPFPVTSRNYGTAASMLVHSKVPVAHPLVLFRPASWGFFLGPDLGLAWMWSSLELGTFLSVFLLCLRLTRGRGRLSALAGLLVVFSPFAQFWSFHKFEILIATCLAALAFEALLRVEGRPAIAAAGLALGWSLATLATHFVYPPMQVTCGWVLVALMAGLAAERVELHGWPRDGRARLLGLATAGVIALGAVGWFFLASRDGFLAQLGSEYPGRRFCTGGDVPPWMFAATDLYVFQDVLHRSSWDFVGNPCESAGFLFVFVPILCAYAWRSLGRGERTDPVAAALGAVIVVMVVFGAVGFPAWLAQASLFYMVNGHRVFLALGLADSLLLARFLAVGPRLQTLEALVLSAGWALLLSLTIASLHALTPKVSLATYLVASAVHGLVAFALLTRRGAAAALLLLLALSVLNTAFFNPRVQGGAAFLRENPVSKAALAADRAAGGTSRWAVFGPAAMGNLLRVLGLDCVSGTLHHPLARLWERIDPRGELRPAWNRYAQFEFEVGSAPAVAMHVVQLDLVRVTLAPESGALAAFGVTHVLASDADTEAFRRAGFVPGESAGFYRIFTRQRPLPPP